MLFIYYVYLSLLLLKHYWSLYFNYWLITWYLYKPLALSSGFCFIQHRHSNSILTRSVAAHELYLYIFTSGSCNFIWIRGQLFHLLWNNFILSQVDSFRDNNTTTVNTLVGDAIFNMILFWVVLFCFVTYQLPHLQSVLRNEEE
jgi:hypothetical protein